MIDPAIIRCEPDRARSGLKARGGRYLPAFEQAAKLDAERRAMSAEVERLRAQRNAASQRIGKAKADKDETLARTLMGEVAEGKRRLAELEAELAPLAERARLALLGLPNLPHESVPVGTSEADNVVLRSGLEPRAPGFKPLDHQTLGETLGILDFAAAAKLSGSRFALWKGAGARLMRAITAFQLDRHVKAGYLEVSPPCLVRPEILEGTGQLPKFEADLYKTMNGEADKASPLYLIPTAEVPLTNLVRDEIVPSQRLPMKLTAYTPCFRQEAGSYGKDVRGLIRNHQFDKVELVWITRPEDSLQALEQLTRDAEAILAELELPHRVLSLCTADLSAASRKTYDLEVWMPSEKRYREISSCSDCGDYQARRMSARFKRDAKASPEFVHTLNGSGVAVGRLFAAILENYQQSDGSVLIPKALRPFFGSDAIVRA
ncbi:MAG: serine--tRNA ligase [Elusimicrobia bacterium]|nr:serine--tRNA ligase [Elusimicrobiota bacterium]MDE2424395.1 serine--tRNA ligase [Elusimicrobiota bacterium]